MTSEQQTVYEKIIQMANDDRTVDKLMFIYAPGGTGKPFVLNLAFQQGLNDGRNPIVVASSGIAKVFNKNRKNRTLQL